MEIKDGYVEWKGNDIPDCVPDPLPVSLEACFSSGWGSSRYRGLQKSSGVYPGKNYRCLESDCEFKEVEPQAGEWWDFGDRHSHHRVGFCLGRSPDGEEILWYDKDHACCYAASMRGVKPDRLIPDCTGFDHFDEPETHVIDVDPGEGYRWLEDHELVKTSDEVFDCGDWMWAEHSCIGKPAGDMCYRRKINPSTKTITLRKWIYRTSAHQGWVESDWHETLPEFLEGRKLIKIDEKTIEVPVTEGDS